MTFLPGWAQTLADFLPFKWTFSFPIEALVGRLSTTDLLGWLAIQAFLVIAGTIVLAVSWKGAVKRYSAVGN